MEWTGHQLESSTPAARETLLKQHSRRSTSPVKRGVREPCVQVFFAAARGCLPQFERAAEVDAAIAACSLDLTEAEYARLMQAAAASASWEQVRRPAAHAARVARAAHAAWGACLVWALRLRAAS